MLCLKTNLGSKNFLGPKFVWVPTKFCSEIFWGSEINFGSEIERLVRKIFRIRKKNLGPEKNLGPKFFLGQFSIF